jgi:hypothetical protein
MKGLFPYIRELLLGTKQDPIDTPKCVGRFSQQCSASPHELCASGYCWEHHFIHCTVRNHFTGEIVYDCQYQPKEDRELAALRKMIQ